MGLGDSLCRRRPMIEGVLHKQRGANERKQKGSGLLLLGLIKSQRLYGRMNHGIIVFSQVTVKLPGIKLWQSGTSKLKDKKDVHTPGILHFHHLHIFFNHPNLIRFSFFNSELTFCSTKKTFEHLTLKFRLRPFQNGHLVHSNEIVIYENK